jgi:uncharacterized protein (TIGR02271 family)
LILQLFTTDLKGTLMSEDESKVIPIIEEEVLVEKRVVESGGVRVSKRIHEREEVVDEPLRQERVMVERRSINQRVEKAPTIRREGTTLIIPVVEEIMVVEKQLFLKEEIHITTQQTEVRQPQKVILRREEAIVNDLEPPERKEQ